jgi:hypothetical protein
LHSLGYKKGGEGEEPPYLNSYKNMEPDKLDETVPMTVMKI